uniref:Uncharacterized protein n=1 Tax=Castor canadensis TaxID=51338 RepID=A0A8C0WV06_CASCN
MDIASEDTHYEEKKASPGHSGNSIHHSSHLAGAKAKSNSSTISLPAPQKTPKEASQALPGVGTVPPACTAALPSSHSKVNSSHYLHPAQSHSPMLGTIDLGRILEPGGLGSSGQWDMMRPQKGSMSGDLSSVHQYTSLPPNPQVRHRAERVTLLLSHLGRDPSIHPLVAAPGGVHLCQ